MKTNKTRKSYSKPDLVRQVDLIDLCMEEVRRTGQTPAVVASRIIEMRDHWVRLSNYDKKELAISGLAQLVNSAMARERQERVMAEQRDQQQRTAAMKEECDRKEAIRREKAKREEDERISEQRKTEKMLDDIRSNKSLQEEVGRIHEAIHDVWSCDSKSCAQKVGGVAMIRCIGGPEIVFLSSDEKARHIKEAAAYVNKIECMHREILCRSRVCAESFHAKVKCLRFITWHSEEGEQQKEIDRFRACNQSIIDSEKRMFDTIIGIGRVDGYNQAVADLKSIVLLSANGKMKSLQEFTLRDVRKWHSQCEANSRAWSERKAWFSAAENALVDNKVNAIFDLPQKKIRDLAASAVLVWKKETEQEPDDS